MDITSIPPIIPILPSPHLVLFPQTHVALHIPRTFFERVKEDSPPGELFLGIVVRKMQPLTQTAILPIGCVAKVVQSYDLPCGQAVHLDLHGLKKFRMREGWFEGGYGQAKVEMVEEQSGLSPQRKAHLLAARKDLIPMKPGLPAMEKNQRPEEGDEVFLNLLCLESDLSPMDKYFLLEANNLDQRCGRLLDLLRFKYDDKGLIGGSCKKDR